MRILRGQTILIVATAWLAMPLHVFADEARDAAVAEMTRALGQMPPPVKLLPDDAQAGGWNLRKGLLGNPNGKIPPKYRQLIALGVAAQIPCAYCVYAHTKFAKANGATDEEIREAVGYAGETRLWGTILQGNEYDLGQFKDEVDTIWKHIAERSAKSNKATALSSSSR